MLTAFFLIRRLSCFLLILITFLLAIQSIRGKFGNKIVASALILIVFSEIYLFLLPVTFSVPNVSVKNIDKVAISILQNCKRTDEQYYYESGDVQYYVTVFDGKTHKKKNVLKKGKVNNAEYQISFLRFDRDWEWFGVAMCPTGDIFITYENKSIVIEYNYGRSSSAFIWTNVAPAHFYKKKLELIEMSERCILLEDYNNSHSPICTETSPSSGFR